MDNGGWLMPGRTLVHNNTGQPGRVVSPVQEKALAGGPQVVHNDISTCRLPARRRPRLVLPEGRAAGRGPHPGRPCDRLCAAGRARFLDPARQPGRAAAGALTVMAAYAALPTFWSDREGARIGGVGEPDCEDGIGGRASLVTEDGERQNFHRSARAPPATRSHAGHTIHLLRHRRS